MLELCTLGTGGTLPLPDRALSSLYVRQNGRAMLIDCGEGTQVGIRKLGWGFRCIEDVLLTHYHGDHCTGLAGLLLSLEKAGKTEALRIWGPKGLKRVVEGLCVIVPPLSYPVLLHELPPEGEELPDTRQTLRCCAPRWRHLQESHLPHRQTQSSYQRPEPGLPGGRSGRKRFSERRVKGLPWCFPRIHARARR